MMIVVLHRILVAGGLNDASVLVDRDGAVAMAIAVESSTVSPPGMTSVGANERNQPSQDGTHQRQKDDCLDH